MLIKSCVNHSIKKIIFVGVKPDFKLGVVNFCTEQGLVRQCWFIIECVKSTLRLASCVLLKFSFKVSKTRSGGPEL